MTENSTNDRRAWSEEEDDALRTLYDTLQANRWNLIAQRLQTDYGFPGRSGKQCRQRYNNHLDPALSKDEWSTQEELRLFKLHDQLGNKWAVISQRLSTGRTDNAVKNHFYSRLRKSVRRLNKVILENYKKSMREIKPQVIYKIIEACEQAFKPEHMCSCQLSNLGCELKNRILLAEDGEEDQFKGLIQMIHDFNHAYKRKPKKLRRGGSTNGVVDDLVKLQLIPKSNSFADKNIPKAPFSALFQRNGFHCPIETEVPAKISITTEASIKCHTQKMISPIILAGNSNSSSASDSRRSEQVLSALGLLEEQASTPSPGRQAEVCPQSQEFKLFDESSAEIKVEPNANPIFPKAVKSQLLYNN